ncbi:MAG: pilus assembly protein TadG-related protein [Limimaricola soesokkakensis]|uniref:pilus assembly protein TadG-related protein n=1 Tax=Limimaricola soesokkakensis TaxID=1343159 RepID=UPI0040594ECA
MLARKLSNDHVSTPGALEVPHTAQARRPIRHVLDRLADLRCDSTGAIAIMAAAMMPFLAVGMGLGAETGYHYMQQRNLQHAVDLAAHAGAVRLRAGDGKARIQAAALHVATQSGFNAAQGTITVHTPPVTGPNTGSTGSVEVLLTETQPRYFSAIFIDEPVELGTRAVASVEPSNSKACVLALSPTAPRAITVSGSTEVSLDNCDVASNSNASDALYMANSMAKMTVGCVHTVGEAVTSSGLGLLSCPAPNQYAPVVRDPYGAVPEPRVEGTCISEAQKDEASFQPNFTHSSGVQAMRICGGIDIKKKVSFAPGLYIIDGGDLSLNANGTVSTADASISVDGATFYLTGNARLKLTGNGSLNMTAPKDGPYAGILFFASRSQSGVTHEVLGNSGSITQGAVYAPSAAVRFAGNSTTTSGCTQVIGFTVEFTGNSTLKSSCETSNAREIQTNVMVRITE